jgi:5'(3')-deoxyribonucleotidase
MADVLTDSPELLRLGIDLDGVVADFNRGWMDRYNQAHGTALDPSRIVGWDGLHQLTGFASMDAFWAWARNGGSPGSASVFRDLPLMPEAIETLKRLASRHRIAVLTARFDWAIPDTLAWLADVGVPAREIHFVSEKQQVACDVYLDDAPYQLEALVNGRPDATVCRAVRPWNLPMAGVLDVHTWSEFADIVDGVADRHARLRG